LSPREVGNNVLMRWTDPSEFLTLGSQSRDGTRLETCEPGEVTA
jgi:hypothetical protein